MFKYHTIIAMTVLSSLMNLSHRTKRSTLHKNLNICPVFVEKDDRRVRVFKVTQGFRLASVIGHGPIICVYDRK